MSAAQELAARTAELETARLQIEQLEGAATASQTTINAQAAEIAGHVATIGTMQETIDGHAEAMEAAHADLTGQVASLTEQLGTATAENGELKKKMENPAYKMAGVEGEDPDAAGGGGEGGEGGAGLLAEYSKLTGAAKTAFYKAHKDELLALR